MGRSQFIQFSCSNFWGFDFNFFGNTPKNDSNDPLLSRRVASICSYLQWSFSVLILATRGVAEFSEIFRCQMDPNHQGFMLDVVGHSRPRDGVLDVPLFVQSSRL